MMAGNPNYWSMNDMHPQSNQLSNSQFVYNVHNNSTSVTSVDSTATAAHHSTDQDFPVRSWSQLLLGGLASGEEERFGESLYEQQNKPENWEEQQVLDLNSISDFARNIPLADMKQEVAQSSSCQVLTYNNNNNNNNIRDDNQFHQANRSSWPHHQVMPVISSPTSCVTTLNNNNNNSFFDFSGGKPAVEGKVNHQHNQEHSSECNSTSTGGVTKKARVQQSSAQPALKVRKEKLGDRITALHQLVSPFGKTDTASVLSEAIGYVRFLQGQIEALSSPYMRNPSVNSGHQHPSVQERNCLFPQEAAGQDSQRRGGKDLRSRGLCLVPISCTENVGNDTSADYWAPSAFGDGF